MIPAAIKITLSYWNLIKTKEIFPELSTSLELFSVVATELRSRHEVRKSHLECQPARASFVFPFLDCGLNCEGHQTEDEAGAEGDVRAQHVVKAKGLREKYFNLELDISCFFSHFFTYFGFVSINV